MKIRSLLLAFFLASSFTAFGQQFETLKSVVANVATNLLTAPAIVDNFYVVNATTNAVTISMYDSGTTSTTNIQPAYISYSSWATNFTNIWVNSAGVTNSNIFSGIFTGPTTNAASTNTLPTISVLMVPASSVASKDVKLIVTKGIAVVADTNVTILTTYRKP